MRLASWIVRLSASLVPGNARSEWRREWLAELEARRRDGAGTTPAVFALGAPRHAVSLRLSGWRADQIVADLRFGVRGLVRRPLFAGAAVLTLGLGIGAATGIFSVVYGVLLKPLPFREPSRLVQLWEVNPLFNWTEATIAPGNLFSWQDRNHVFEAIAYYDGSGTRLSGLTPLTLDGDTPVRVQSLGVSTNFFDVLGVGARLGRTFASGEDRTGAPHVLVASDRFWRQHLGADPAAIGRSIRLNGVPFEVIGAMPAGFVFDRPETEFWIPIEVDRAQMAEVRVPHFWHAIARLKPGVTIAEARTDLVGIARDLEREHPKSNRQMSAGLGPLDDWFVGQTRRPLLLFLGAVGLLLLIACANVANLLLVRANERTREMSLRAALGASRARLIRQLVVEAFVTSTIGTFFGIALAEAGIRAFRATAPAELPRLDEVGMQPAVLAFAVLLTGLTTLLIGLAPAFHGASRRPSTGLGDGARTTPGRQRLRRTLVGGEVALAVVLAVGAMLTVRSFQALLAVDPGFPIDGLTTTSVSLPAARYANNGDATAFYDRALAAIRAIPGVVSAGATNRLPLAGSMWTGDLFIERQPDVHGRELRHKAVTPGYLETLGLRLIAGRTLDKTDGPDAPQVVVVNETLARKFFAAVDPIGQRIAFDARSKNVTWQTIVGVVSDEPQDGIGVPAVEEVYQSDMQEEWRSMAFLVRSSRPADAVLAGVRRVIHDLDPALAPYGARTLASRAAATLARPRVAALLVGVFAVTALLLAAVGIYGVAAGTVTARTREIGLRVALGATRSDVFRLIMRRDLVVVIAGLAVGAALSLVATRSMASLLFGVSATDTASFAVGLAGLLLAGAVATLVPARRALAVDPTVALRSE
jgi:putative ABC transport system permease protein